MRRASILTILVGALAAPLAACDSDEPQGPGDGTRDVQLAIVDFGSEPTDWAQDPFTLLDHGIEGDTLTLNVEYAGGCEQHGFQFVAYDGWLGSEPPQALVLLAHDAHDDACESLIREELRFDLDPIADDYRNTFLASHGRALLRLAVEPPGLITIDYTF